MADYFYFTYDPFAGIYEQQGNGDWLGYATLADCNDHRYAGPEVTIESGPLEVVKKLMQSTLHDMLVAWLETAVMIISDKPIEPAGPSVTIKL